jgi:CHASE2 domain-containing sensor protein
LADRGLTAARTFVYILIALLYWILAFLARREQFQRQQSPQKRKELFLITGTAMSKCILTTVMMLITKFWHIPPPTPTLLLAISTYFYFNFFGFSRQRG